MPQFLSRRANPYHNAWTESFMGTLKSEMLQGGRFIDATDARTEIFDYIDAYYNNHLKHSALGYQPPPNSRPKSTLLTKPQTVQKSVASQPLRKLMRGPAGGEKGGGGGLSG